MLDRIVERFTGRIPERHDIPAASGEERRRSLIRLQGLLDSGQFGVLEFAGVVDQLIRLQGGFHDAERVESSWTIPLQVPETGGIVTLQVTKNGFEQTHTIILDGAEVTEQYIGDHGPYFPFSLISIVHISRATQPQFRSPFHGNNQDVPAHDVTILDKVEGKDIQQRLRDILTPYLAQ